VNGSRNLIVNRGAPPFDNPDLRRAMSLTLDRQAFIDIMGQGNGAIGGPMEPPPEGLWGMPAAMLKALPGYGPDVAGRRAEARQIMEKLGYGPDKRLAITVAARNVPPWRDPALILIDQLKEIYIDGELEPVDTTQWYPRLMRKDYKVGLNVTESEVDDPDAQFYENYSCGALRNYTGYCNKSVDELIRPAIAGKQRRQSAAASLANRKEADRRRCAPGHLIRARHHLPAPLCQRSDEHGQQHLQWLALRGRLARQIALGCAGDATD
jgi:peptide/nickel transport system substrate-binding protein